MDNWISSNAFPASIELIIWCFFFFFCFCSIEMVNSTDWFSNVKPILHSWNKSLLNHWKRYRGMELAGREGWGHTAALRWVMHTYGPSFYYYFFQLYTYMCVCVCACAYKLHIVLFVCIVHNKMCYNKNINNNMFKSFENQDQKGHISGKTWNDNFGARRNRNWNRQIKEIETVINETSLPQTSRLRCLMWFFHTFGKFLPYTSCSRKYRENCETNFMRLSVTYISKLNKYIRRKVNYRPIWQKFLIQLTESNSVLKSNISWLKFFLGI